MGGVEVRKGPDYGEIFDHHAVEFEYADGSRCFSQCRHINGCWSDVSEHVVGTKGTCHVGGGRGEYTIRDFNGKEIWRFAGDGENPYQQEHDDLFEAIRKDKPFDESETGANSTMTAILGRMATYSGKIVEWDAAIKSKIDLFPKSLAWDADMAVKPGPDGWYGHAGPRKTVVG